MIVMNPLWYRVIKGKGLISYQAINSRGGEFPKHHRAQRYCMIFNMSGIIEIKYISHSSENYIGERYDQQSKK